MRPSYPCFAIYGGILLLFCARAGAVDHSPVVQAPAPATDVNKAAADDADRRAIEAEKRGDFSGQIKALNDETDAR